MKALTNVLKWLKSCVPTQRQIASNLRGTESGMEVSFQNAPPLVVEWSEVLAIVAYKADAFSTDLVCFDFICRNESVITIDENTAGFNALVDSLPTVFDGFLEGWRSFVIQPPFARNETIVWQAESTEQDGIQ